MPSKYEKQRSGPLLRKVIRDKLERAILTGELEPGQALQQQSLAQQYGVSRSPLREALCMLEAEGLVASTPDHGFIVSELGKSDIEEIYELLICLESRAVGSALPGPKSRRLATMRGAFKKMESGLDLMTGWRQVDAEFHGALYARVTNERLGANIRRLRANVGRYLRKEELLDRAALQEHRAILRACEAGDVAAAREAVVAHLERERDRLTGSSE